MGNGIGSLGYFKKKKKETRKRFKKWGAMKA